MNVFAAPTTPLLTVVMPIYNAMPYLDDAIESILEQTYGNFRLALYDDHSTDGSYERALAWSRRDARIELLRGSDRLGPSGSSNAAADMAKTEFVARMDADDISLPARLEVQLKALQDNPDAGLVGSTFEMVDGSGKRFRRSTPSRILGYAPPFAHSTIMYRRQHFEAAGKYKQKTDYFEDLDLYLRIARLGRILVVNEPLVQLRFAGQHARLRDDRSDVLRKIDRLYHPDGDITPRGKRYSVSAYYSVAVLSILSLQRPKMLLEIIRGGSFTDPVRSIMVLGMVGVAEISPRAARALSRCLAGIRERIYAPRIGKELLHDWTPRH